MTETTKSLAKKPGIFKEILRNTIKEILSEISVLDDNKSTIEASDIYEIGDKINTKDIDTSELNTEIEKIIKTGKGGFSNDHAFRTNKRKEFDYLTTVLASLYKNANSDEKTKIMQFIFTAFVPNEKASFIKLVAKRARISNIESHISKQSNVFDIIMNSIYDSIPKALQTYDLEKGSNFKTWLTNISYQKIYDNLQKEYGAIEGGERKYYKTTSLDEPINGESGEETYSSMLQEPEEGFSEEQTYGMQRLADAINYYIKNNILKTKNQKEFYRLHAEEGLNLAQIENITGRIDSALRRERGTIEKEINKHIQSGELRDFILKTTGQDIYKIEKIKDIIASDNKFSFGNIGKPSKIEESIRNIVREVLKEIKL